VEFRALLFVYSDCRATVPLVSGSPNTGTNPLGVLPVQPSGPASANVTRGCCKLIVIIIHSNELLNQAACPGFR
jgi:hypothetical protein